MRLGKQIRFDYLPVDGDYSHPESVGIPEDDLEAATEIIRPIGPRDVYPVLGWMDQSQLHCRLRHCRIGASHRTVTKLR